MEHGALAFLDWMNVKQHPHPIPIDLRGVVIPPAKEQVNAATERKAEAQGSEK